jgi:hypothetical protein
MCLLNLIGLLGVKGVADAAVREHGPEQGAEVGSVDNRVGFSAPSKEFFLYFFFFGEQ